MTYDINKFTIAEKQMHDAIYLAVTQGLKDYVTNVDPKNILIGLLKHASAFALMHDLAPFQLADYFSHAESIVKTSIEKTKVRMEFKPEL